MNRTPKPLLTSFFASVCCVLGACSGSNSSASKTPSAAAGSNGSSGANGSDAGSTTGGTNEGGGANAVAGQAGANALGGSGALGGRGGGAGQGGGPASSIDYSLWVLQLPTGSATSPTTISSSQLLAGYSDAYFYPAADGGQTFMAPATGITTSGSQHCRTEMRESTASGGQAAWSSSGTNVLTVSGKVLEVGGGSSGNVTVGQLFNGTDSIPLCELQYSTGKGGFELLYEEAKGQGSETDLKTPLALGSKYTFSLALTQGVVRRHRQRHARVHAHAQCEHPRQEVLLQIRQLRSDRVRWSSRYDALHRRRDLRRRSRAQLERRPRAFVSARSRPLTTSRDATERPFATDGIGRGLCSNATSN